MLFLTTLSYDQLGELIRSRRLSINNIDLFYDREDTTILANYIKSKLGYDGFVLGIRGKISPESVDVLRQLDPELAGDKVILELTISDDSALVFDIKEFIGALMSIDSHLPDEEVIEQLNFALEAGSSAPGPKLLCVPFLSKDGRIRLTSLNDEIEVEGMSFVKVT